MSSNPELNIFQGQSETISRDQFDAALAEAERFLRQEAPSLGRMFGIDLDIEIGQGWATDLESGKVTADPRFFIDRGYTPEMAIFGVLHEVAAHLQEVVRHPKLTQEVVKFVKKGEAYSIFHNIFSDIAGNKQIFAIMPSMADVATQTYSEKLFSSSDYSTSHPRHLQFLYSIIRAEMIPGVSTAVRPEVAEAIAALRDFEGKGDLIAYATSTAKPGTKQPMDPSERFALWKVYILPIYEMLLTQDIEEPLELEKPAEGDSSKPQGQQGQGQKSDAIKQSGQNKENTSNEQPDEQNQSDSSDNTDASHSSSVKRPPSADYSDFYKEYRDTIHPEPEEIKHVHDKRPKAKETPEQIIAKEFKEQTGYDIRAKQTYDNIVREYLEAINEMRDAFMLIVNERITKIKKLKGGHKDGALLNPDQLAQTVIDVQSGVTEPPAFLDYERHSAEREIAGNTDYHFVVDISGSMQGEKAYMTTRSIIIALEGLSAMQRDIARLERTENVITDMEIRTALYTFGVGSQCVKPLSSTIDEKHRLTVMDKTSNPNDVSTDDFSALEMILQNMPPETTKKSIIVVLTDGQSSDVSRAKKAIHQLRQRKNTFVIGLSIGSDAAVTLYKPDAEFIDDVNGLPKAFKRIILKTI